MWEYSDDWDHPRFSSGKTQESHWPGCTRPQSEDQEDLSPLGHQNNFQVLQHTLSVLGPCEEQHPRREERWVYEVPCMDCEQVYIGEIGRTMQKRVTEHKTAVWKYDKNNGIAVHAWSEDHRIDCEAARVRARALQYWKRMVVEALQIQQQSSRMNLDCGLDISSIWKPLLTAERSTSQLLPMS